MSNVIEDLIPVPQEVTALGGVFDADGCRWRVHPASLKDVAVAFKLREELGVEPAADELGEHTVVVGAPNCAGIEPPERPQGYVLCVRPDGIVVRGHDGDGLYWGLVTLEQLLSGTSAAPCVEISDWPVFAIRGHHDDISRKQVSTVDDFRRIIRLLSRYKVNLYTPYMEDMLFLKSYPDIGEGRGRLMPDEVAAMHEEAERHRVTIMPTYSLIGHQENLLANEKYAPLGREVFQPMSSLDPTKPEVREFLTNVIRDVCELFPGPYFHAGFDETQGVGGQEFLDHANWCARQLKKHGKLMPMWVDMIYSHFGYDMIEQLEDNIIPVNWQYGATEGEVKHQRELAACGRPVWGLAGYGTGGTFLPNFKRGKDNIDTWCRSGMATDTPALAASQWGDGGYENHRDFPWNMFAYLGEATWSGPRARRDDFERRFQLSFYGVELPELSDIIDNLGDRLSLPLGAFWQHFRRKSFWTVRWAAANPDAAAGLASDESELNAALEAVERCREQAVREKEHLEHFRVGMLRMLSVVHRLQFGLRHVAGLSEEEVSAGAEAVKEELRVVREAYSADWLRTNKRPNIEVSLHVYEDVMDSYDDLCRAGAGIAGPADGYYLLNLDDVFNEDFLDVGGLPLGRWECNGVPFLFADRDSTHVRFNQDDAPVELVFPEQGIADVHLIVTPHKPADGPCPGVLVELLQGGEVVYHEELLNITHMCDWWAPLGEHIWAGGGMAHVDPYRVRYALKPGTMFGLAETFNFGIPAGTRADCVRITALGEDDIRLFAVTLETC